MESLGGTKPPVGSRGGVPETMQPGIFGRDPQKQNSFSYMIPYPTFLGKKR